MDTVELLCGIFHLLAEFDTKPVNRNMLMLDYLLKELSGQELFLRGMGQQQWGEKVRE